MLGFYNYTVILTYVGMLSGFIGILCATNGEISKAVYFLIAAGVCDMFDGKIASTMKRTKQEKRFGIQIDSLSDFVSFGVLPAVMVYKQCQRNGLSLFLSGFYVLCALIRLAWFNVDEEERQDREEGGRQSYLGLPVTSMAIILPVLMELGASRRWPMQVVAPYALLFSAVAFLTPFRMGKSDVASKAKAFFYGALGVLCVLLMGASS